MRSLIWSRTSNKVNPPVEAEVALLRGVIMAEGEREEEAGGGVALVGEVEAGADE